MARQLSYPEFRDLKQPGDFLLVAGGLDIPYKLRQYAKRQGFAVDIQRIGQGDDGRTQYRVERQS